MDEHQHHDQHQYQLELFERLKKSIGLRKEEECFGCYLHPVLWWIIDKANPTAGDIEAAVSPNCPYLRKASAGHKNACAKEMAVYFQQAAKDRAITTFACKEGLCGFIYPIIQGDRLYGYIGSCYPQKDVPPEVLSIFASFTDTIVREIQKELELSKLYETIRPRAIALSTVHTVHRLISSTLDLNELLPRVARLSLQIMRANRCSIKLVDARRKVLLPKATVDLREKKVRLKKVKIGKHAPGKAFKFGRPFRGDDYISSPLIDEDVIGVITVYDKIDGKPFTAFDQEILTTLSEQAVIAIKNAQLYKEQERLTMGSIKSLATALDAKSPGTSIPRPSFLKIVMAVAHELRLDDAEMKTLEYAALLHDAGQVIVPGEVISKPTKLTGKEYDIVKEHPARGVEIIKHIKALKSVVPIIFHHHENYDGTGYPKRLKKDQIPMGSRILAVVDAFEAMISKRPYRITKTIDQAIAEIDANSGKQFDPVVVKAFIKALKRNDIRSLINKELHEHR